MLMKKAFRSGQKAPVAESFWMLKKESIRCQGSRRQSGGSNPTTCPALVAGGLRSLSCLSTGRALFGWYSLDSAERTQLRTLLMTTRRWAAVNGYAVRRRFAVRWIERTSTPARVFETLAGTASLPSRSNTGWAAGRFASLYRAFFRGAGRWTLNCAGER